MKKDFVAISHFNPALRRPSIKRSLSTWFLYTRVFEKYSRENFGSILSMRLLVRGKITEEKRKNFLTKV
jgi:hypothetical protein